MYKLGISNTAFLLRALCMSSGTFSIFVGRAKLKVTIP